MCTNSTELTRISALLTEILEKYTDTATKVERMYTFLKQGRSVGKGEVTQADVHVRPCKDGDVASDPSEDETKFVSVSILIMSICTCCVSVDIILYLDMYTYRTKVYAYWVSVCTIHRSMPSHLWMQFLLTKKWEPAVLLPPNVPPLPAEVKLIEGMLSN